MASNPLSALFSESPLPSQYGTISNVYAPTQFRTGQANIASGQALEAGGKSALDVAAAGRLTAPQQASLDVYRQGLENQALQTYESMGLTPSKTTSYLSTQADIDAKTNAMAQQFIQTTIALGGAELSAGASFMGIGAGEESAAATEMAQAGAAQIQQDTAYSQLIGQVFGSITKMFSMGTKAAAPSSGG